MVLLQVWQIYTYLNHVVTWHALLSVGAIFSLLWLIYSMLVRPFFSPLRQLPGLPYSPLFGSMLEAVQGETGEVMLKWVKEYGSILRYYFFFGHERVMVADAEALKRIFVTNSRNYIKPPSRMAIVERLIGKGLLLLEGEEHALQKKIVSPAFRPSSLKKMICIFEEHSYQLIDKWERIFTHDNDIGAVVDIEGDLKLTAFDIIGQCAFGYKFRSLMDHHQGESITACFNRLIGGTGLSWTMAIPYYHHLPTPGNKSFNRDKAVIDQTVENVIKHKKSTKLSCQVASDKSDCLLDMLMTARDEDSGRGLTDKELHDQVLTFMIAGHETTSVTLSWALLQLAKYPRIQQKAREELQMVLPPRGQQPITWEHAEQLKYLNCVIKETLRLYPAGPITMREAVCDDYLGKYFIPAGTFIVCNMGACMRLPENWSDPDEFIPERFEDEKSISASVFLPFITGPRKCMGYRFAIMEMTVLLAMLLREFEFRTIPDVHYKQLMRATVRPFPALKLEISRVSSTTEGKITEDVHRAEV